MNLKQKYTNLNDSKDVNYNNEQGEIVCPHCGKTIKKGELKIDKKNKTIIHGKCEGMVYFSEDLLFDSSEELFENKNEYVKGKVTNMLAKAIKNLDISDIGDIGQRKQPTEFKSSDPLKDAKEGKHDKPFDPPKQNK